MKMIQVYAYRYAKKIDLKTLNKDFEDKIIHRDPSIFAISDAESVTIFRYGIAVIFSESNVAPKALLDQFKKYAQNIEEEEMSEELKVKTNCKEDKVLTSHVETSSLTPEKQAIISIVLAKSLALERFENELENVLSSMGQIIDELSSGGRIRMSNKMLLKKVGEAIKINHGVVSQLSMLDKPDLTWDSRELDRFYQQLSEEYEIRYRYQVLQDKLDFIIRDVEFIMNFLDNRKSFFMELIIILLISVEIVIFFFENLF